MNNAKRPSKACVLRLELYLEVLEQMQKEGLEYTTSAYIGKILGIPGVNVRQDLFGLGSAGRPKVGYDIPRLIKLVRDLFDLDREKPACIIGFGNLGEALAGSAIWSKSGYKLAAIFDNDPEIVGSDFDGLRVRNIAEIFGVVKTEEIEMAVLTIPAIEAQSVADLAISAGVRAIWNFAPIKLQAPENVAVENQSLAWGLITLAHESKMSSSPE